MDARIFFALALWLPAARAFPAPGAFDMRIAPIVFDEGSGAEDSARRVPERDLLERLRSNFRGEKLSFSRLSPAEPGRGSLSLERRGSAPRTFFEAALMCQATDCSCLLYGYVKRTAYSYYAELKLVAPGGAGPSAVFVGGDDEGHYERLMDDLTAKIARYIRGDLGIGSPGPRPARNLLSFPASIGYWTPAGFGWNAALAGLVASSVGVRFAPERPLFALWSRPGYVALGLDLEYALGTNQPGLENFYLHAARLRLPVEVMLELGGGHRLGLGAGPLFDADTMLQARKYASTFTETRIECGASLAALYSWDLSRSLSLGFGNIVDFIFYAPPLVVYSPRLSVELHLGAGEEGLNHE
ncbi:MAG TPA: hypothetical protein VMV90_16055 [Rectinemataceae bacterium]|nr:hypothetical protein [Rectinemataceae bacterium]